MNIRVNMPSGASKNFHVSEGSTLADLVNQIPELQAGEFSIRVKGKDLNSDEAVQPDVMRKLEMEDGDEVSFTPNIIGG